MPTSIRSLPTGPVKRILACLPFKDRWAAASVCKDWRHILSVAGSLSEACVLLASSTASRHTFSQGKAVVLSQGQVASLLQWLARHPLQQLQYSAAFYSLGSADADSLLPMLLASMAAATPHLQALRIDVPAATHLSNGHLPLFAAFAPTLRQLALLGCTWLTSTHICVLMSSLTKLQDLALRLDSSEVLDCDDLVDEPPFLDVLLSAAASSCHQLRSLTLSGCRYSNWEGSSRNMPDAVSRLTRLTALALHGREDRLSLAPAMTHMTALKQLSLDTRSFQLRHQLSALQSLETLQFCAGVLAWRDALPVSLTKLVILPEDLQLADDRESRVDQDFQAFCPVVAALPALRHLALMEAEWMPRHVRRLVTAVGSMDSLRSLHMVGCRLTALPPGFGTCLHHLHLLDLRANPSLFSQDGAALAAGGWQHMAACRSLDLGFESVAPSDPPLLGQAALAALASMPALEVAALGTHDEDVSALFAAAWHAAGGTAALAAQIPASISWSSVPIKIPFEECNALLGQQLDTEFEDLTPNTFDGSGTHAWPPWEDEDDGF